MLFGSLARTWSASYFTLLSFVTYFLTWPLYWPKLREDRERDNNQQGSPRPLGTVALPEKKIPLPENFGSYGSSWVATDTAITRLPGGWSPREGRWEKIKWDIFLLFGALEVSSSGPWDRARGLLLELSAQLCLLLGFWMHWVQVMGDWREKILWTHHWWDLMVVWILVFFLNLPAAIYFSQFSNHASCILFMLYSWRQRERKGEAYLFHFPGNWSPAFLYL